MVTVELPPPLEPLDGATITTGVSAGVGSATEELSSLAILGTADEVGPSVTCVSVVVASALPTSVVGVFSSSITPGSLVGPTTPLTSSPA